MSEHFKRCGVCPACIDRELTFLSRMEQELWAEARGDLTRYLEAMATWTDMFNAQRGMKR